MSLKNIKINLTTKIVEFFLITLYMGKLARAGSGARIFDKLETEPHKNGPEPHKNGPAPQHCWILISGNFDRNGIQANRSVLYVLSLAVLRSRIIFMRLRLRVKSLMRLRRLRLRLLPYCIARQNF
jgi:hypothetical protein